MVQLPIEIVLHHSHLGCMHDDKRISGIEGAGDVVEVGVGVTDFKRADFPDMSGGAS